MAGKFEITNAGDGTSHLNYVLMIMQSVKALFLTRRTLAREVLRLLRRTAD